MANIVKLDIAENVCYDGEPANCTVFLKTESLDDITGRIQKAFIEYLKRLGYGNAGRDIMEEAGWDDGVYFGNSFKDVSADIQKKYGFEIVQGYDLRLDADFDRGME